MTTTVPCGPAGAMTSNFPESTYFTAVAAFAPKVTVAPSTKFSPLIITVLPPFGCPKAGFTDVTTGAGSFTCKLALGILFVRIAPA
ncbi:hypothetical protein D3C81_1756190 [compost metagenome]